MTRWRVRSGDLDALAEAPTAWGAFLAAVRAENPKTLGIVAECESLDRPVGDDTIWYCSVERNLKEAGLWGRPGERPAP